MLKPLHKNIIIIVLLAIGLPLVFFGLRTLRATYNVLENPQRKDSAFIDLYPKVVLTSLWEDYQTQIQSDGRTIDEDRDMITTSEGQSYSLLRAVWMDDKETFDRVLNWTEANLQVRDDKLFAWKWGRKQNGDWGVLEDGGINSASDADLDIALALVMAGMRWNQADYHIKAREIMNDIWEVEIVEVNGKPYLTAGNWAKLEQQPTLNPSYFSFAAYEIFADFDPSHDWIGLKNSSYEVLNEATFNLYDNNEGKLPPDWVKIDRTTGQIVQADESHKSIFADDAIRVFWRVSQDWSWHSDPRAQEYLSKTVPFLINEWNQNRKIFASYDNQGNRISNFESFSLYGAIVDAVKIVDPKTGREIFYSKIASTFNPNTETFYELLDLGYYSKNWVWFGMSLYLDQLPNIYKDMRYDA